jgi:hypothetical protein
VLEYDSVFCANARCALHVRPGDVNVKGNGNWAETAEGVITGRRRVGTVMLCDQCAPRAVCGKLPLHGECTPQALGHVTSRLKCPLWTCLTRHFFFLALAKHCGLDGVVNIIS